MQIPLPVYFVAGKGVAADSYRIIGSPNAPYTSFEAAKAAAEAAIGLPDNFFESAVFEAKVAFRAT